MDIFFLMMSTNIDFFSRWLQSDILFSMDSSQNLIRSEKKCQEKKHGKLNATRKWFIKYSVHKHLGWPSWRMTFMARFTKKIMVRIPKIHVASEKK